MISEFLLERYEESDEDEDTILNLNVAILNNQYQRIRATSIKNKFSIENPTQFPNIC